MMVIEVVITVVLVLFVAHILYHNFIKNFFGGPGFSCCKDKKSKKFNK